MAKDFFNIVELTMATTGDIHNAQSMASPTPVVLLCSAQIRVQLAIAQQLSVISGHLAKLIELCEKQSNK